VLETIKELGEWNINEEEKEILSVLVENPFPQQQPKKEYVFLAICFQNQLFEKVIIEEFEPSRVMKYLYRKGAANGPDFTPCAKLTHPRKTWNMKIRGWFEKVQKNQIDLETEDIYFITYILKEMQDKEPLILSEVERLTQGFTAKTNCLISIKIDGKYIGEYSLFKKMLLRLVNEKFDTISTSNQTCSICGNIREKVYGNASSYAFYTIDKPGFIVGGFEEQLSWRNFPLCSECILAIEEGKKYLQQNLMFNFYGLQYFLIPRFLLGKNFVKSETLQALKGNRTISLSNIERKKFLITEDDILDVLVNENDVLNFSFLFLRKSQSAERILLVIEDVFPSRLKRIFEAKKRVDQLFDDENYNFSFIRQFFGKTEPEKKNADLNGYFLNIIDSVFTAKLINKTFLYRFFMKDVRRAFQRDEYFSLITKKALCNLIFFQYLKIISFDWNGVECLMGQNQSIDNLFDKYGEFMRDSVKRGIVLTGVLTELLLRKQYHDRKAKPFMKNLKGLRMNEKDIRGLIPKVQNKLSEYDSFDQGKRMIATLATEYLMSGGDDWNMSVDEINFFFAAGMNLTSEVAKIIYQKEIPEEVQENDPNNQ
jgi:CRISPR-associated protein Csh1